MWKIIIIFFIICLILWVGKYVLFEPRINSALTIAFNIYVLFKLTEVSFGVILLFILSIADCVTDIFIAKYYYRNIEDGIDSFYCFKSIVSLLTFGMARGIFLLVIEPFLFWMAWHDVNRTLKNNKVILAEIVSRRPFWRQYKLHFFWLLNKKVEEGTVLSNKDIIDQEHELSSEKLENSYPKKLMEKLGEMLSKDKSLKNERENAEREIASLSSYYAYTDADYFIQCKKEIADKLSKRGTLSPHSIAQIVELSDLNALKYNNYIVNSTWIDYFVIFVLNSLVNDGVFEEHNFSDAIMENHQYRNVNGAAMLIRNAEDNPELALDDD